MHVADFFFIPLAPIGLALIPLGLFSLVLLLLLLLLGVGC